MKRPKSRFFGEAIKDQHPHLLFFVAWITLILTLAFTTIFLFDLINIPSPEEIQRTERLEYQIENIKAVWDILPKGIITFNSPKEMHQGVKERVEVRVSKNISGLSEFLMMRLKSRDEREPPYEEIKIAPQMTVELLGDEKNFEIKPLFTISKQAFVGDYIQWEWDVIPLKSGNQTLFLCIYAVIEIPDYPEKYVKLPVMEKEIYVNIDYGYVASSFIFQEWKWILSAITGLVGYYIGRRRPRTTSPSPIAIRPPAHR